MIKNFLKFKWRQFTAHLGWHQVYQHWCHRSIRMRRKRAKNWKSAWRSDCKVPLPGEGIRHTSPWSTEASIKHIIIRTPKAKDKGRILKAAREKQLITYEGAPIRLSADFSTKLCRLEGSGTKYAKWWKPRTYKQDYSMHQSSHSEWKDRTRASLTRKS